MAENNRNKTKHQKNHHILCPEPTKNIVTQVLNKVLLGINLLEYDFLYIHFFVLQRKEFSEELSLRNKGKLFLIYVQKEIKININIPNNSVNKSVNKMNWQFFKNRQAGENKERDSYN